MSKKEESLDEKIARIRKQNEAIQQRKKLIAAEIEDAERNNAIVKLKNKTFEEDENDEFGRTLYSDKLSPERKPGKSFEEDVWNAKTRSRKSTLQNNNTDDEWREERKRIDEERIRRQKANSGSWKREWDADKIVSSQEQGYRTSKDAGNRFNRTSSISERPENRGTYNYNDSRGNYNQFNTNEDDHTQNRWKTDDSFRKTYSERRTSDNYDNRKSTRNDGWRTNVSETDQYNNNASKSFPKNNSRSGIQNTPFTTRIDKSGEENWDSLKSYSKTKFRNDDFTTKNYQSGEESWDAAKPYSKTNSRNDTQFNSFTTKNDQFQEENWNVEPINVIQSVNPKSNDFHPAGNIKPPVGSQEKERLSSAQNRSRPFVLNNRLVQSNKSSNSNTQSISKSENNSKTPEKNGIERKDHESSGSIPKDLKNIVVQVGNSGFSSSKREVKRFEDLKPDSNVPNFSFNQNTSREVDSKTLPSYGSMTFERSDLKQKVIPIYTDNLSSPTSIATQLFSNSKLNDADSNSEPVNFTGTRKNDTQNFVTDFQSPGVFQFSATSNKPDFGDIIHNITSQDVKITRTIRNENLKVIKEPTKKPCGIKTNRDIQKTADPVKCAKVVKNEDSGEEKFEDDDEWDDCSDDEVEEEFV